MTREPAPMERFSLDTFVSDTKNRTEDLGTEHIEKLFVALASAERPRSLRVLTWMLLRTLQSRPGFPSSQ